MQLTNPQKLKKGNVIGIVSPSAGLASLFPHRVKQGEQALQKLGLKVLFAPNSLKNKGYVSASPQERADDLHQLFSNPEVSAILCTIGGNHSNQLLKYLDFNLISSNPKIFIGYSDITVLHYAFAKKSSLRTFYGPCLLPEFGEYPEPLSYTVQYFIKAIMHTAPIGKIEPSSLWTDEFLDWAEKKDLERPRKLYPSKGYEWWKEGKVEGEIFGGAIPSINHLAGTEFWVEMKGKIFFIDIPEGAPGKAFPLSELDSFLADLDNLNVFRDIQGLIIGRPYQYTTENILLLKEIINYYTKDFDYPILFNANIGHTSPIITLPLGVRVRLNSEENLFEIVESGVTE